VTTESDLRRLHQSEARQLELSAEIERLRKRVRYLEQQLLQLTKKEST
jgi:hypothetical protein